MKLLKIVTIVAGLLLGNAYANDKPKPNIYETLNKSGWTKMNGVNISSILEGMAQFGKFTIHYDTIDNQPPKQLKENAISFKELNLTISETLNISLTYHCYDYQVQDDNSLLIAKTDDCANQKFPIQDQTLSMEFAGMKGSTINDIIAQMEDKKIIYIHDLKMKGQENMYIQYPEYYYNKKLYIRAINQTPFDFMQAMTMVNCQDYKIVEPDYLIIAQSDNCPAFSPATTDDENKLKALLSQPFNKANLENSEVAYREFMNFLHGRTVWTALENPENTFIDLANFIHKNAGLNIAYPIGDTGLMPQKDNETLYDRLKSELDNRCLTYRFVNDKFVVFVPANTCEMTQIPPS